MESMDTMGTSQQYQSLLALCPPFLFLSRGTGLVIVCLSPQSSETQLFLPSPLSSQSPHTETAAGVPAIESVGALCCHQACRPHLLLSMAVFRPVCLPLSGTPPGTASKRACPSHALPSFPERGPHWFFPSLVAFFPCFWSVSLTGLEDPRGRKLHLPCSLLCFQTSTVSLSL